MTAATPTADIVLATLNARWTHASLGLRALRANLGPLAVRARIEEATLSTPMEEVVARCLAGSPRIIGLGVYIWNVTQTTELVRQLRAAAPQVRIVLGGPEVSHETEAQEIVRLADHVITGAGEQAFARLALQLLEGPRPLQKRIAGGDPDPETLQLPYDEYTDTDIAHRHLYVEASRGCPFRCEFCLSALDRSARPFPLDEFLAALSRLYARGARRFRFVDRTFNLRIETAQRILRLLLDWVEAAPDSALFAHFELIPDRLPEALRALIVRFPPGVLQFEIGIQTWNPEVQARISRKQDNARAADTLAWLRQHTQAHLHVDLIAGLPGETLASFGTGFDRLIQLNPHEIQVGLLKRLRGAPIRRHTEAFGMDYADAPPYEVRSTHALSATEVAQIRRFARYWDLIGNSGRFPRTLPALLGDAPFERFLALSDHLWDTLGATHRVSAEALADAVWQWLSIDAEAGTPSELRERLIADYAQSGARGRPAFLERGLAGGASAAGSRQLRHVAQTDAGAIPELSAPALPSVP